MEERVVLATYLWQPPPNAVNPQWDSATNWYNRSRPNERTSVPGPNDDVQFFDEGTVDTIYLSNNAARSVDIQGDVRFRNGALQAQRIDTRGASDVSFNNVKLNVTNVLNSLSETMTFQSTRSTVRSMVTERSNVSLANSELYVQSYLSMRTTDDMPEYASILSLSSSQVLIGPRDALYSAPNNTVEILSGGLFEAINTEISGDAGVKLITRPLDVQQAYPGWFRLQNVEVNGLVDNQGVVELRWYNASWGDKTSFFASYKQHSDAYLQVSLVSSTNSRLRVGGSIQLDGILVPHLPANYDIRPLAPGERYEFIAVDDPDALQGRFDRLERWYSESKGFHQERGVFGTIRYDYPRQLVELLIVEEPLLVNVPQFVEPDGWHLTTDDNGVPRQSRENLLLALSGYNATAESWPIPLVNEMSVNPNSASWDMTVLEWKQFNGSSADAVSGFRNPWSAASHAVDIGESLANWLRDVGFDRYATIHLLAHSAGSWLIDSLADQLRAIGYKGHIHLTFFDAFTPPSYTDVLSYTWDLLVPQSQHTLNHLYHWGAPGNRLLVPDDLVDDGLASTDIYAEHFYDRRDVVYGDFGFNGGDWSSLLIGGLLLPKPQAWFIPTLPFTQHPFRNAFNIDVSYRDADRRVLFTLDDDEILNTVIHSHSWPIDFYRQTLQKKPNGAPVQAHASFYGPRYSKLFLGHDVTFDAYHPKGFLRTLRPWDTDTVPPPPHDAPGTVRAPRIDPSGILRQGAGQVAIAPSASVALSMTTGDNHILAASWEVNLTTWTELARLAVELGGNRKGGVVIHVDDRQILALDSSFAPEALTSALPITTNFDEPLAPGRHRIYVQILSYDGQPFSVQLGQLEFQDADPSLVPTDTTSPTVSIAAVSPDPRSTPVGNVTIQFSETISGFDLADLSLTRSGNAVSLAGLVLQKQNATQYTIDLTSVTAAAGSYSLTLVAAPAGIRDLANNPLVTGVTESWTTAVTISSVNVVSYGLSQQFLHPTQLSAKIIGAPYESHTVSFVALQQATDPLNEGHLLGSVMVTTDVFGVAWPSLGLDSSVNGEYIAIRIQDSDGDDVTATFAPTVIGPNTTARVAFASSIYNDLLKRDAVLSELVTKEISGQTPLQIASSLVESEEFDHKTVRSIYQALLGSEPTTAQLNSGVSLLQSGQPNNALRQQILLSDEFRANQGGGLDNPSGYVAAVYQKLLGRAATANELSDAVFRIGESGRNSFVQSMLSLQEFRVRQVNGWFAGPGGSSLAPANLLGRAPTTAELNAMTAALALNGNEDQIIAQIVGSVGTANGSEYYFIRMVRSVFRDYLKRDPTTSGTKFWVNKLLSGADNESSFRASVLASAEFFINNGSDNTRFVQDVFRKLLGREVETSSPNELAGSLSLITQLGGSRTAMANSILATPGALNTEYLARSSGAAVWTNASTADISKVQGLAEYLLGRPFTAYDTIDVVKTLETGASPNAVLASILFNPEYYEKQGGTPTGYVTGLYQQLLGSVTPSISVSEAVAQLQSGMTREQFALNLLDGPDFAKVLGFQGWASSMVSDLLKRPAGYGDWLPYAQQAAAGASLADVATAFLNSAAYRTVVIQNLFLDIVKREVKANGLNFWLNAFAKGQTERDLIIGLTTSAEYFALAGGTNTTFIKSAFLYLVGRNPTDNGLNFWLTQLNAGQSRSNLITGLLDSAEYVGRKVSLAVAWLAPGAVDAATQAQWTSQIRAGQMTYRRMYANILSGAGWVERTTSATIESRPH